MVADLKTDDFGAEPAIPDEDGEGVVARYRRGEIDILTAVSMLPESKVPPFLLTAYQAFVDMSKGEPDALRPSDPQKRQEFFDRLVDMVEQWRVDRGPAYVETYLEFKQTGAAVSAGVRVFESDWFKALQQGRQARVDELTQKAKTQTLPPEDQIERDTLQASIAGDEDVARNWQALRDQYAEHAAQEKTGALSAKDLRARDDELKRSMFEQLDKASPELRDRLLSEMEAQKPGFREQYRAHAEQHRNARAVIPDSPPVSEELMVASANSDLEAGLFDDGAINAAVSAARAFNRMAPPQPDASALAPDATATGTGPRHLAPSI